MRYCPVGKDDCLLLTEVESLEHDCLRLKALAEIDALTGLYNYQYLIKVLGLEMERTIRTGLPTALIMIDLDHFKQINDLYGHETGNLALKAASAVWTGNIRRLDVACRYGGEEFAIVLPAARLHRALMTAGRLRKILEASPVDAGDTKIFLTASFGVEVFEPDKFSSPESFIMSADEMLLVAKRAGRNRVYYRGAGEKAAATALSLDEKEALLGRGEK